MSIKFLNKLMKDLNTQIKNIIQNLAMKYGTKVLFREYEFTLNSNSNISFYYRCQSGINMNYLYEIQIYILNIKKKRIYLKRCLYCNKTNCNYKFTCCNYATHFQCAVKNKFNCCNLTKLLNKSLDEKECCVCYEPCNTTTNCNHNICSRCLLLMSSNKIECPYCRTEILNKEFHEFSNIEVFNILKKNIPIRITYLTHLDTSNTIG